MKRIQGDLLILAMAGENHTYVELIPDGDVQP